MLAFPLMQAAWLAIKASRLLQILMIVLPLGGYIGLKAKSAMHVSRVRNEATTIERQAAEIRALTLQKLILQVYSARGAKAVAARDASIESQSDQIGKLQLELEGYRNASARFSNPARPVFRSDDPWMRQGGTSTATGGAPERRR